MAAKFPLPIAFSLPDGWNSVSPDSVDADGAAFVALRSGVNGTFTTNIAIFGEVRAGDVPLTSLGDAAVDRLRSIYPSVQLVRRKEVGTDENPGLTQVVRLNPVVDGKPRPVVQVQVLMGALDQSNGSERAVMRIVLSTLPEQLSRAVHEFQAFLATIRLEEGR